MTSTTALVDKAKETEAMNPIAEKIFNDWAEDTGARSDQMLRYRSAFVAGMVAQGILSGCLPVDEPANTNSPHAPTELPIGDGR